jgi:uncharacterized damage-inducible protein DinB
MPRMLKLLRDLVAHKAHANAALLQAIRRNGAAAEDADIRELLHHILLANRFWLLTLLGLPFVLENEARQARSLDELIDRYAAIQAQEAAWCDAATEGDPARMLENPLIPNGQCSVAHAVVQVCLHSHGHRAQCAKLLRRHGIDPPASDFITWVASVNP